MPDVEDAGSEDFYKAVGQKVRFARVAAGMSQALLASHVGLTRSSVANLEAARQHISLYHFILISHALNTTIDDLLPLSPRVDGSPLPENLENELANSPTTARTFVRGAVARLHSSDAEE